MDMVLLILWIIVGVAVNRLYHKIFNVVYFGANGIFKELGWTIIVSGFIVGAIVGTIGKIFM